MKGYGAKSMLENDVSQAVAAGATATVGHGHIRDTDQSRNIRFRLQASGVSLGGGSLTATIYHAPSAADTLVSTGKTISITANGDFTSIINDSDTGLVPLYPYIEIKVVSVGAAVGTIDKCDMFVAR